MSHSYPEGIDFLREEKNLAEVHRADVTLRPYPCQPGRRTRFTIDEDSVLQDEHLGGASIELTLFRAGGRR